MVNPSSCPILILTEPKTTLLILLRLLFPQPRQPFRYAPRLTSPMAFMIPLLSRYLPQILEHLLFLSLLNKRKRSATTSLELRLVRSWVSESFLLPFSFVGANRPCLVWLIPNVSLCLPMSRKNKNLLYFLSQSLDESNKRAGKNSVPPQGKVA